MKRLLLTLLWVVTATLPLTVQAQVYARVPTAPPPPWAPAGFPRAKYYYLPDLQMYYDVPAASFILFNRGQWIAVRQLPPMYRSYDLYASPKVVLDYYGPYPFGHYEVHRQRFPRWHCAPHSVIVYRESPRHGGPPPRAHHPRSRYRYNDDYRYDRKWNDHQYDHNPHPDRRDDDRLYNERYWEEQDRRPGQEHRRGDQEDEYDYDRRNDHRRYEDSGSRW